MNIGKINPEEVLLEGSYISEETLDEAKKISGQRGSSVVDYLLSEDILSINILGQAIAEHFQTSFVDLESQVPPEETVRKLPGKISLENKAVLYKEEGENLFIAVSEPHDTNIQPIAQVLFPDKNIIIAFAFADAIEDVLHIFRVQIGSALTSLIEKGGAVAPEIVSHIFNEAIALKASDIHFDPRETEVWVRFRVDGVLLQTAVLPADSFMAVNNRIKILANLRIDDHLSAQDGAIQFIDADKNKTDMRVSIIPTLNGEKIVIRLFDSSAQDIPLSELGFSDTNEEILLKAAAKPFGMILVTGPTGSGKTTTLYSLLRKFNTSDVNVMTIEDPVEYRIDGINQVQVSTKTDFTFAKGLRSLMRQDPNIMLVGEIRDHETADIAVNAALTGHLLFSTFHANDAATAFPRLMDMGIEPFLLSSTIELVVGQRLVRKLCDSCRYSYTLPRHELEKSFPQPERYFDGEVTLYASKGCSVCSGIGYRGRIAIIELIQNSTELGRLIVQGPTDKQIWDIARENGSRTLFEDGLDKVKAGITTMDELLRVAQPPST